MLKNRFLSFLILLIVYVLATIEGCMIFGKFSHSFEISLLISDIAATILVFIFSLAFSNASVYDPYWSVQPIVLLFAMAKMYGLNFLGFLLFTAVFYWGMRLTINWAVTFKNLTVQDWRYTMLAEKCGIFYPFINFIGIHMIPTLIVFFCTLPAIEAIKHQYVFKPLCAVFIGFSVIAATIQLIADRQMHKFQKDKAENPDSAKNMTFIRRGLWKHARHPNYFGEILMWWGIGLACVAAMPSKWYLLAGALANTLLFCFVSIPMAEKKQSKKPGFDEYKKQTRILI